MRVWMSAAASTRHQRAVFLAAYEIVRNEVNTRWLERSAPWASSALPHRTLLAGRLRAIEDGLVRRAGSFAASELP
jgi:hypothetical protein